MDMEDDIVSILSQGFYYCLKQGVTGFHLHEKLIDLKFF